MKPGPDLSAVGMYENPRVTALNLAIILLRKRGLMALWIDSMVASLEFGGAFTVYEIDAGNNRCVVNVVGENRKAQRQHQPGI